MSVAPGPSELVVITGLSGSGKGSVLKTLEDLGYYAVDNLPVGLIPKFAELTHDSSNIRCAALVVDIREGSNLREFPAIYSKIKKTVPTRLVFLEAEDATIQRRFSETRRPHPLGTGRSVNKAIAEERRLLEPIRQMADITIDTSKFTVHELRDVISERFRGESSESRLMIYVTSFGFRHGLPPDSDLVFDVRFLPNPNYIPKFRKLTGKNPSVAKFVRSFPQTQEFMARITDLLLYLIPHYVKEKKSYLTISFGCTGGHHRSVMMAEQIAKTLQKAGHKVKVTHRDVAKPV